MIINDKNDFEKKLRKLEKTSFFKIIGFIHFKFIAICSLILIFIGYLKNISILTRIPFYYSLIVITHWVFFKNECLIQYFLKKKMYKNYKLGDNANLAPDSYDHFKPYESNFTIYYINQLLIIFLFVKNKTLFEYQLLIILIYLLICCTYTSNYVDMHFDRFGHPKSKINVEHPTFFEKVIYNAIVSKTITEETNKLEKQKINKKK